MNPTNGILTERYFIMDGKNKRPSGVFVGFYDEVAGKIRTGFSRVNLVKGDKFNMEIGIAMAVQQAVLQNVTLKEYPKGSKQYLAQQDFWDSYMIFKDRANRYFRQGETDVPPNQIDIGKVLNSKIDWMKLAQELFNGRMSMPIAGMGIIGSTKEDYRQADLLLGEIKGMFKNLGYSPIQIFPLIKGMGLADKEGMDLIKKHFPELDVSGIRVI